MILHIVKKDLRRLWPLVVALVLVHLIFLAIQLNLFPGAAALQDYARILDGSTIGGPMFPSVNVVNLMGFFLAVMVVQLDPIPGDRQDWLVRPLRRRDLLLAKLLFVVAAIHLPMLAADVIQGLGFGASTGLSFTEAFWRNLYLALTVSLPGLLAGALTRGIGQMLGLMTAVIFGLLIGAQILAYLLFGFPDVVPAMGAAVTGWVFRAALFLGLATAILGLQYFRRATALSRLLFVGMIVVLVSSQMFISRRAAFAMQEWVLPSQPVSLVLAPQAGMAANAGQQPPGFGRVVVPLRVENLAPGQMAVAENLRSTLIAPDGKRSVLGGGAINRLMVMTGKDGAVFTQAIAVAPEVMDSLRGRKGLRLEMEYMLAVLQPEISRPLAANGGDQAVADGLRCTSRMSEGGAKDDLARVRLECRQTGQVWMGVTATLAGQDDLAFLYLPTDVPYRRNTDMLNEFAGTLTVTGKAPPPTVTVTLSRPLAFALRRVVIEDFRLADWQDSAP